MYIMCIITIIYMIQLNLNLACCSRVSQQIYRATRKFHASTLSNIIIQSLTLDVNYSQLTFNIIHCFTALALIKLVCSICAPTSFFYFGKLVTNWTILDVVDAVVKRLDAYN